MTVDFEAFWAGGDAVTHAVFWVLVAMSLLSWSIIFFKSWQLGQLRRRAPGAVRSFWQAGDWQHGMIQLSVLPVFAELAQDGMRGRDWVREQQAHGSEHLSDLLPAAEMVVQALRGSLTRINSRLEAGQTMLASIGSTAPFVGLFGTVWGIYHALMTIGTNHQLALDQIAGPVGEALIMTALGLFVAIPAVLAYNAFNRQLRLIAADLDGFAHDLHLYCVGSLRQG